MAKQVVAHIELEGGTELEEASYLCIEQDLFGHHTFELHLPFEQLEDPNELFFHESHQKVCGKTIQFSFDPLLEQGSFSFKFKGLITELSLKNTSALSNTFVLKGYSPTILLEDSRVRRSFLGQPLGNIANQVLDPYPSNLVKRSVKPRQKAQQKYVVQYDETAFEFLARLAAEYGEWCFYDGQQLVFGEPPSGPSIDFLVDGTQTFDMALRLLPSRFLYTRYDYLANQSYESHSDDQQVSGLGQWSQFTLDESENTFGQETQVPLPKPVYGQSELDEIAKTQKAAQTSRLVEFRGSGENPEYSVGSVIKVKGTKLTERGSSEEAFGSYRITHIRHELSGSGNYANTFRAVPESVSTPPPNPTFRLPLGQPELATVTDNQDPEKLGRVKVEFLWPGQDKQSDWLRVAHAYTADGEGMLFVPEIDAQVLVAYEGNLAEYPFVLSSFYPKAGGNTYTERDNVLKRIQTKGGNQILLHDKDGEQQIELTNTNQTGTRLLLSFASDGKITLETDGPVEIKGRDITITASNDLTLEAQNNVKIKGKVGVEVKGAEIKAEAEATASLKSNGQVTVEGTQTSVKGNAMVEVKGGVIMLN
ncbi:MAG: hypothetical protein H7Y12_07215 [Sphingobacteriaceae bacterium]|nr:hypothetical protein [Cytophagaceae bacterium]